MKNQFKTLAIISPGFPANEADTTCMPAQQIFVRTLNELFPELKIVIVALQYPFFDGEYQWHGNTILSFDGMKFRYFGRPLLWLKVYRQLNHLHKSLGIDGVLNFWCAESALIGRFFARRHAITHYTWILGQDARKQNQFVRWIKPKGEELIALSSFLKKEFYNNHHIVPGHLIENGVSVGLFKPAKGRRDIDVLGAGSLSALKQYSVFIEVIFHIKKYIPNVTAVLCGKGPEINKLRQQIRNLNLEQNIILKGEVSHETMLETMQRARVFLHPSSYEGYSTVCLEALYAGCHVMSFWSGEETAINHWHIVKNKDEMSEKCTSLLQTRKLDSSPVLLYRMEESVKKIMALYHHKAESTS